MEKVTSTHDAVQVLVPGVVYAQVGGGGWGIYWNNIKYNSPVLYSYNPHSSVINPVSHVGIRWFDWPCFDSFGFSM